MTDARVQLWGRDIAAVTWLDDQDVSVFQYDPEFANSRIEVAPLTMPLRSEPYQFPDLSRNTFRGLPGLLADSLPDRFGNALINAWLARQGRVPSSFNPVERLCYIGSRGMGALEFLPTIVGTPDGSRQIEVASLVQLANEVLDQRADLAGTFSGEDDTAVIQDILRVGTSAGGARAKAILAWNESTNEFRSGQVPPESGFTHWLMKFDGVNNNRDKELADPQGYGKIEYAYCLMATGAGIQMNPCRLHHEGQRSHFMTKRFDRTDAGAKLHMQSLGALTLFDFNLAGAHSYEQAILTMKRLRLPTEDIQQQVRRAFFNAMARNQDDHVKNIAFLMDREGQWRLAPAFDVAYSYNPTGEWTSQHQMTLNGKRDAFERDDLIALASMADIKARKAANMIQEIGHSLALWPQHAETAGIRPVDAERIAKTFRIELAKR